MASEEIAQQERFPELPWEDVVQRVERIAFQILAGPSAGTCFAVSIGRSAQVEGVHYMFATAWHVVKEVAGSDEALYMISADGKTVCEAKPGCYAVFPLGSAAFDTALVLVRSSSVLVSPGMLLPMFGPESVMARGTEIGLVGFPGIVGSEFCFFKGTVSGYLSSPPTYLVDAVAINGVSGGPAFDNRGQIIGLVSSYIPNRIGEHAMLPGLVTLIPIGLVRYWMETKMRARVL